MDNNNYYVYQLRIEGEDMPFYVGKGKDRRCYEHFKESSLKFPYYKNRKIKKAKEQGKEILVEFIEKDLSENDAYSLEILCIGLYGRIHHGGCLTNHNWGGKGNAREVSEETRVKIGNAAKGRVVSDLTRIKLSKANKGKKLTADHIEKGRVAKIGEKNPCAKLTEDMVVHAYLLSFENYTPTQISKIFGVAPRTIRDILNNMTWKHLYSKYMKDA